MKWLNKPSAASSVLLSPNTCWNFQSSVGRLGVVVVLAALEEVEDVCRLLEDPELSKDPWARELLEGEDIIEIIFLWKWCKKF